MNEQLYAAWFLGLAGGFVLGWACGPLIERIEARLLALLRAEGE
jgi:hypothetical protein